MFNANNYIIEKFRRVTQVNLVNGYVDWTATSIENPQIEFTGDAVEKTDAYGVLISKIDTAKGVNLSGEVSMISMPLMAAQLGAEVQVATEEVKLTGKTFEVLPVKEGSATLTYAPKVAPKYVCALSADKNIDSYIDVGTEEGNAQITGTTVTMPIDFAGTHIGVLYEYETSAAVKVVNKSEEFAEAAQYIVDILAHDVCNPALKRAGSIVFPKAKIDNNFTLDLTTEGTHPFSFSALKDYCSEDAELCYIIWNE